VFLFNARKVARPALVLLALVVLGGCSAGPATVASAGNARDPDWLGIELTEVTSGETFTIAGFSGQVVLLETMATWCPTCRQEGNEVKKLHQALGSSDEVVSVSLDVDPNEDAALLAKYASGSSFDWRFAVAPKELGRALADLYGSEFLNPPYAPMLIVDRDGGVHPLPDYLKTADTLQAALAPYLAQ
jgi:cytochrome oxidase Cu insertion factor (SCO1/SenC/PrrC family)